MTELIKESHQVAKDLFSDACLDKFGIKPIDDDKLILDAAVCF